MFPVKVWGYTQTRWTNNWEGSETFLVRSMDRKRGRARGRGHVKNGPKLVKKNLDNPFENLLRFFKARSLQCGFWLWSSQILIWILPWILGAFFLLFFSKETPWSPFLCFFRFLCFFGVVSTLAFFLVQRAFGGSKKRSFDEKSVGRKF